MSRPRSVMATKPAVTTATVTSEIEKNIMSITTNKAASADGRLPVTTGGQRARTCGLRDTTASRCAWMAVVSLCPQLLVLLGTNSTATIRSHPVSGLTARSLLQES
jgi:hypothetical protein